MPVSFHGQFYQPAFAEYSKIGQPAEPAANRAIDDCPYIRIGSYCAVGCGACDAPLSGDSFRICPQERFSTARQYITASATPHPSALRAATFPSRGRLWRGACLRWGASPRRSVRSKIAPASESVRVPMAKTERTGIGTLRSLFSGQP